MVTDVCYFFKFGYPVVDFIDHFCIWVQMSPWRKLGFDTISP